MTEESSHRILIGSTLVTLSAITWQEIKGRHEAPLPARYVGAGIIFAIIDVVSPIVGDDVSAVLAIGIAIVLIVKGLGSKATSAPAASAKPAAGSGAPAPAGQGANPTAPGRTAPNLGGNLGGAIGRATG